MSFFLLIRKGDNKYRGTKHVYANPVPVCHLSTVNAFFLMTKLFRKRVQVAIRCMKLIKTSFCAHTYILKF